MPDDFWGLEVREIAIKIDAYEDKKVDELFWLRWQTTHLLNIHLEEKNKIKAERLFPLSIDKKKSKKSGELEKKQIEKRLEKWDRKPVKQVVVDDNTLKKLFGIQ